MRQLTDFKAVYCSGLFIQEPSTVSALSLLFEKIYLPKNISLVEEFAKKYKVEKKTADFSNTTIINKDTNNEAFSSLSIVQKQTAFEYINKGIQFANFYKTLFPEVFESNFYEGFNISPEDLKKVNESKKPVTISISFDLDFGDTNDRFSQLVNGGYIPIVDNNWPDIGPNQFLDDITAKQIASLLAMKSIEIIFPSTQGVHPDIILEARDRLSDYLPPFWSAMLKLSVEMKKNIKECKSMSEVLKESQHLVDTLVLPALIDLQQKMLREKKSWFYKILSPIQRGLRLMIGNPPLSQQQLITNALVLGSDVIMSAADNMRTIEAMKEQAGLTFLLEANKIVSKNNKYRKCT